MKILNEFLNLLEIHKRESRLVEAMGNACKNIQKYTVHSKRPGSLRYSRDEHPSIKSFKEMRLQCLIIYLILLCVLQFIRVQIYFLHTFTHLKA